MKKRFINLEDLPKLKCSNSERIDWINSIGSKVSFEYNDIKGEFEILENIKDTKKIKILYQGQEFEIRKDSFLKCEFGRVLGKRTKEFKIEIGSVFQDKGRNITIIDREHRDRSDGENRKDKYYKYRCNRCSYEGWIRENQLLGSGGCACCRGRVVVEDINSIWKTDSWMLGLGVSLTDSKSYTSNSNKKINVTCPNCGNKKQITPNYIYRYKTISCTCGDGFSYPEKFMFSVLKQLNLEFETQLTKTTFGWCGSYRYDFYIPKYNMIIETHGEQHYREANKFKKTLDEEQENDRIKEELAKDNGIKHYVIINCEKVNKDWLTNSILNSKLKELFDLTSINWEIAELYAIRNNICKEISNYWNNREDWETTYTIARNNEWSIKSPATILKYVKRGVKLGWCEYNTKDEWLRGLCNTVNPQSKPIRIFKNNILLGEFKSTNQLQQKSEELFGVKLYRNEIVRHERESKEYKGYTFEYIKN